MVVELRGRLNVCPKNHSNSGVDVFVGRGCGVMMTEHCKVMLSPIVMLIGAEGEMDTDPMFTAMA